MKKTEQTTPIRELMPDGYLPKLVELTGVSRSNISNTVRDERTTSKIWPFVEQLARQTNAAARTATPIHVPTAVGSAGEGGR